MRTYLDHNATSPIAAAVADAVDRVQRDCVGNPSSVHADGQHAKTVLDEARASLAMLLHAETAELVFTGGGTEADNLALRGTAEAAEAVGKRHLIVSAIEHEAVLATAKVLARRGWSVTSLPVTASGYVEPAALDAALRDDTALVSVMLANNEIGTVQPVAELAALAHARGALFHTDAVQAVAKIEVDVRALGVDLLALAAHKFQGPKGVGALWVRRGTRVFATQTGGRQERNRRAGTENVPAIAGLGVAARLAREHLPHVGATVGALRDRLERGVLDRVSGTAVNGGPGPRVPNTSNISFEGVEAESLLIALDLEGFAVSTGSACSSGTLEPSHVLRAMGCTSHRTQSSLRFSLGPSNTADEVDRLLEILPRLVARLRSLAGARRTTRPGSRLQAPGSGLQDGRPSKQ